MNRLPIHANFSFHRLIRVRRWLLLALLASPVVNADPVTVEAEGVASCGDLSIADCKAMALEDAKRNASEQGAGALVASNSTMENYLLTSDVVVSNVKARIVNYTTLESGLMGETGYRYLIKATVVPDLSQATTGDDENAQPVATKNAIPEWIMLPKVKDSFAASACIPTTGRMTMDRRMASASARADLAQQVTVRVIAFDEEVMNLEGGAVPTTFTSTTRNLAAQALRNSRVQRAEYLPIEGTRHFCVMIAMPESGARSLFDELLKAGNVSPDQETANSLYASFTES